jgi:hypothetical protein
MPSEDLFICAKDLFVEAIADWPGQVSRRHCHSIVVLEKPSSLLIEHDGLMHFRERSLDHPLRQSVPLQYPIIERHQHFELCERRLP